MRYDTLAPIPSTLRIGRYPAFHGPVTRPQSMYADLYPDSSPAGDLRAGVATYLDARPHHTPTGTR